MGRLRIIAGSLKGRRIPVPRDSVLRPTADRVREALFSILGPDLPGAIVLDAYAGTGALGFEAISRGAARVLFLERDRQAAAVLRATAGELGVDRQCTVVVGEVVPSLCSGRAEGPFDLILADPPYGGFEEVGRFLPAAAVRQGAEGRLVLERPTSSQTAGADGLELTRSVRYGSCRLDFYRSTRFSPGPGESGPGGGAFRSDGSRGETS